MSSDWSDFSSDLLEPIPGSNQRLRLRRASSLPTGKEAGIDWDGTQGEVRTGPVSASIGDWDDLLRSWDLDPAEVEVVGNVKRSSWQMPGVDGPVTLHSYKASLRRRTRSADVDLEKLFEEMSNYRPSAPWRKDLYSGNSDLAYLHCVSDTQIGKDSPEESWARFAKSCDDGVRRLEDLRSIGRRIDTVYLPWVGDCIENVSGHYASQQFSVTLSLTEQVRLFRRMMLHQIKVYAPLAPFLVAVSVPGNHDEASRINGRQSTNNSDSWAVDVASQVHDVLQGNPGAFGHVSVVVPKGQDLTVSVDIKGTATGFAHGHQFKGGDSGWRTWWAGQAHGCQDIGDTTLLIAGHKHHFSMKREGAKTFLQLPSQDSGSQWWTDRSGQHSEAGAVTLTVGQGSWGDLHIL